MTDPLVSICTLAYNHKKYISESIESFLMQKTNFQFEILIHDDASTDGTEEIIRDYELKYPEIIKPLYEKENQWVQGRRGSAVFNFPRAHGKYIALCEGDDYWTDPYKLQKQVDFMEKNPEYGLVYADILVIDANGKAVNNYLPYLGLKKAYKSGNIFFDLLENNFIPTMTVCVRKELIMSLLSLKSIDYKYVYDMWFWLNISAKTKVMFFNEKLAAYRIHPNGITNSPGYLANRQPHIYYDVINRNIRSGLFVNISNEEKTKLILRVYNLIRSHKLKISKRISMLIFLISSPAYYLVLLKSFFKKFQSL